MTYIEKIQHNENGKIREAECDPQSIIATRPFLTSERLEVNARRRRRGAKLLPEIVATPDGTKYAVDGHHKIRRACDVRDVSISCRVLNTANPALIAKLQRRNHGPISQLTIRGN